MNKLKKTLLFIFMPFLCFAHGEEALYYMFSEFIFMFIIVGIIFSLNIKWIKRWILVATLFISYFLSFFIVVMPFRNNEILIVFLQMLFTITCVTIAYLVINKNKN